MQHGALHHGASRHDAASPVIAARTLRRHGWLAPLAAVILATGCARAPSPDVAPRTMVADTVWYVSARARVDGIDSQLLADSLEYGFAILTRERVADPYTDAVDVTIADSVPLSEADFVARLRARTDAGVAPDDFAVLYVHGYATSLHEAWTYAAVARVRTGADAPWIAFAWPSNGSGIASPRIGALFARAYHDDSAAAASSRPAFVRALRSVIAGTVASRLVLAPHSLGAQVVGESLADDLPLRITLGATPLRAVAFIAPDVESRRFAKYIVPAVSPLTRRVLLYASSGDRVLALSRGINKSQRAGLHDGTPLTHDGLETVDVSDGVGAGGWLQRVFGTHHAIRRASGTLFDLARVVGAERVPDCRLTLGTATLGGDRIWRLGPAIPRGAAPEQRCAATHP
ncbi:MAG TPA: alpha/beta hydrolase [Gemmatimonadaceae bacterium]|nr:alpha/beta hydrolase [Gemmatimonadaceae bacterium]